MGKKKEVKKTVVLNKNLYLAMIILVFAIISLLAWIAFKNTEDNLEDNTINTDNTEQREFNQDDSTNTESLADDLINKFTEKKGSKTEENDSSNDLEISMDTSKFSMVTTLPDYTSDLEFKWDEKVAYIGNGSDVYDDKCPNEEVFMLPGFDELSIISDVYCIDDTFFSDADLLKVTYELSYLSSSVTKTEMDTNLNFRITHISDLTSLGKLGQDKYGIGKFSSDAASEWGAKYSGSGYLEINDDEGIKTIYFIPEIIYENLGMENDAWYMVAATYSEDEINESDLHAFTLSGDVVIMREAK